MMDLLFPNPHKNATDPQAQEKLPMPRSPSEFVKVWSHAVGQYRETWIGFWTQRGFLIQDPPEEQAQSTKEETDKKQHPQEAMLDNAKRNAAFVQQEAANLKQTVRDQTGIHSAQDLRNVLENAMQLAAECVQEFMAGYRKGRDDEVEKMMTQYFEEWKEASNQEPVKRRRRKRRVMGKSAFSW